MRRYDRNDREIKGNRRTAPLRDASVVPRCALSYLQDAPVSEIARSTHKLDVLVDVFVDVPVDVFVDMFVDVCVCNVIPTQINYTMRLYLQ